MFIFHQLNSANSQIDNLSSTFSWHLQLPVLFLLVLFPLSGHLSSVSEKSRGENTCLKKQVTSTLTECFSCFCSAFSLFPSTPTQVITPGTPVYGCGYIHYNYNTQSCHLLASSFQEVPVLPHKLHLTLDCPMQFSSELQNHFNISDGPI